MLLLALLFGCSPKDTDAVSTDTSAPSPSDSDPGGDGGPPGGDGGGGDGGDGGDGGASDTDTVFGETGDPGAAWDGAPGLHELRLDERDVWLYVPSGYDAAAAALPLVIGFHGAGDSGRNFYGVADAYGWTDAAEPANFALLIPSTKSPYDDFAIWSGNPNDDVDEMIAEMGEILAVADTLGETWRLDAALRHAFGFSDGGLFTAVAGMDASESFATLTVLGYGWGGAYPLVTPSRPIPAQFACGDRAGRTHQVSPRLLVNGAWDPSLSPREPPVQTSWGDVV